MEMEILDATEFNPDNPHHPGQEVILRRKELEEKWQRETELSAWEDPELHVKLQKLWSEYWETRRR